MFRVELKSSSNIYRDALIYRQFQILNTLTNVVQTRILEVFIGAVILSLSMNLGVLIGISNAAQSESNIFMIAVFLLETVNGVLAILVIVGGMVWVYTKSKHIIVVAKKLEWKNENRATQRWARRYWLSCVPLKIKFGDTNYLEELTPFKSLGFSLNLSVQFLLLSRSQ